MFTYKQLKTDMEKCINKIKRLTKSGKGGDFCAKEYTKEEYEELRGYMREFMADVEKEYSTKKGKCDRIAYKIQHDRNLKNILKK